MSVIDNALTRERVATADRARRHAWEQLLISTDRFEQAETAFNWRTDRVRERFHIPTDERLSVEALLERSRDETWQNAVKDCDYYSTRMIAFATAHQSAVAELRLLYDA